MSAPEIYGEYVKALVESEDARKASLEQRGAGVITTSSALATLLFTLVGVVTAAKNFALPASAHGYVFAAIALFAAAVTLGLLANVPLLYEQGKPTPEKLAEVWGYDDPLAQGYVIATRLKVLKSARRSNTLKGWLLLAAGLLQLAALVVLVLGVLVILSGNPLPVNR
jgi:hypothetical protein